MGAPPVRYKARRGRVAPAKTRAAEYDEGTIGGERKEAPPEDSDDDDELPTVCCGTCRLDEAQADAGRYGFVLAALESGGALALILALTFFDMATMAAGLAGAINLDAAGWMLASRCVSGAFFAEFTAHWRAHAAVHDFRSFLRARSNRVDGAIVALDAAMLSLDFLLASGGSAATRTVASFGRAGRLLRLLRLLRLVRAARALRALDAKRPLEDLDPMALAENGDAEGIARFFESGVGPRRRDRLWTANDDGETVLYAAAKRGRGGVARAILRSDSPRARDAVEFAERVDGMTPVYVAALHDHRDATYVLAVRGRANLGAAPTSGPSVGVPARDVIAKRGWPEILRGVAALEAGEAAAARRLEDRARRDAASRARDARRARTAAQRELRARRARFGRAVYSATARSEAALRGRAFLRLRSALFSEVEIAAAGTRAARVRLRKASLAAALGDRDAAARLARPPSSEARRVAADGRRLRNLKRRGRELRGSRPGPEGGGGPPLERFAIVRFKESVRTWRTGEEMAARPKIMAETKGEGGGGLQG